jgi:hypothetical protein
MTVTKETTEQAVFLGRLSATAEMLRSCRAAGILLALVHLLLELLGLLLVDEAQPRQALLELKGVEKGAVLVVHPGVEDLLVPNDATAGLLSQAKMLVQHVRRRGRLGIPRRPPS